MSGLRLQQKLATSASSTCDCPKCRSACSRLPGIYHPQALEMIFPTMTKKEKDALIIDYIECFNEEKKCIYYIRPRTSKETGFLAGFFPETEACTFLTDTGCSLQRDRRPTECLALVSCRNISIYGKTNGVPESWNTPLGENLVNQLLQFYGKTVDDLEGEYMKNQSDILLSALQLLNLNL